MVVVVVARKLWLLRWMLRNGFDFVNGFVVMVFIGLLLYLLLVVFIKKHQRN